MMKVLIEILMGLFRYIPSGVGTALRRPLYKMFLKKCGKDLYVQEGVKIKWLNRVSIGDRVAINEFCWFEGSGEIEIGNGVWIAPGVSIASFDHVHTARVHDLMAQDKIYGKVVIENNVWIGTNCCILKGVKIGEGAVVGAGSVVTKDVLPYTVVAGNPAKKIRDVDKTIFFEKGEDK